MTSIKEAGVPGPHKGSTGGQTPPPRMMQAGREAMSAKTIIQSSLWVALLAGMLPADIAQAGDPAVFDGVWLYTRDSGEGVSTVFEVRGSSLTYLSTEGNGLVFARGWWTVDPYANPDAEGLYHVKTELTDSAVVDGPDYEDETMDIEIKMFGPDGGVMRAAGENVRRGVLQRISCVPAVYFVDRSDAPPEGCKWTDVRGLGYDGLTGECRWDEGWADNWDAISRDPDGNLWPAACLVAEPVQFP